MDTRKTDSPGQVTLKSEPYVPIPDEPEPGSSRNTSALKSTPNGIATKSCTNHGSPGAKRTKPSRKVDQKPPPPREEVQYYWQLLLYCKFCHQNGEDEVFYRSHVTRDKDGNVVCPILYVCLASVQGLGPSGQKRRSKPRTRCSYCRYQEEGKKIHQSHTLRDKDGIVTCPLLSRVICPLCKATGPTAHTLLYCPLNKNAQTSRDKTIKPSASEDPQPKGDPTVGG